MDSDAELARLHDAVRVSALVRRKFDPDEFWDAVLPLVGGAGHVEVEEIGRSALGRPLRAVRHGGGPVQVLVWSQMHGDEPTGTMALADLLAYLAGHPDDDRVRAWTEAITLWVVPILNPDGAARYQRRNAQGIDVNRDAVRMRTPELRALERLVERIQPGFAFTLHDQEARTRVGTSERMSALSLVPPTLDAAGSDSAARLRAKGLCTCIRRAVQPLVGDHVARFEENYSPAIVGVALQQRGISTVLVETGWWPEDPELQFLRKVNFVGLVAALDAIRTGAYEPVDLKEYEEIPENDRDVFDVLIRGGTVVLPGAEPYPADIGMDFDESLDLENGHVADVGDLAGYSARDVLIAEGFFVHPLPEALSVDEDGAALDVGRPASFAVRRGPEPDSEAVWMIERGVARRVDRGPGAAAENG